MEVFNNISSSTWSKKERKFCGNLFSNFHKYNSTISWEIRDTYWEISNALKEIIAWWNMAGFLMQGSFLNFNHFYFIISLKYDQRFQLYHSLNPSCHPFSSVKVQQAAKTETTWGLSHVVSDYLCNRRPEKPNKKRWGNPKTSSIREHPPSLKGEWWEVGFRVPKPEVSGSIWNHVGVYMSGTKPTKRGLVTGA